MHQHLRIGGNFRDVQVTGTVTSTNSWGQGCVVGSEAGNLVFPDSQVQRWEDPRCPAAQGWARMVRSPKLGGAHGGGELTYLLPITFFIVFKILIFLNESFAF